MSYDETGVLSGEGGKGDEAMWAVGGGCMLIAGYFES